jgi:2,4-dienoyl-CoA reductase (NADPH2)
MRAAHPGPAVRGVDRRSDEVKPGERKLPELFRPGRIGRFTTKNLIKYGACCVSNYNERDGRISKRELARTRIIAGTGCGIVTNQGAYPDPLGEGKAYFRQIAIHDDRFLPEFEEIAGYIHDAGAIAIQQILHAGRYGGSTWATASSPRSSRRRCRTSGRRAR